MSNLSRLKALEKLFSPVTEFTMFYSDEAIIEYCEERKKFLNGEAKHELIAEFCDRRFKETKDKIYTLQRVKETNYTLKEYSLMLALVMERAEELKKQDVRRN